MALYKQKGSKVLWYEFQFNGERIRTSSKTPNKRLADEAMRVHRRQLEEGHNNIKRRSGPKSFDKAAEEYLAVKQAKLSKSTLLIEQYSIKRLQPLFGRKLLCDITAIDIRKFQDGRLAEGASERTINIEVGTLRGILRRNMLWESLRCDVSLLKTYEEHGKAIDKEEERTLLRACQASRSRILYPVVQMALCTGMRHSEVRHLIWKRVDLVKAELTVGHSKTATGTGRKIVLNNRLLAVLRDWADKFPQRESKHYVFPAEKFSGPNPKGTLTIYDQDPTKPIGSWKKAWGNACRSAGLKIRYHDLRHTAVTRMLEAGTPLPTVAAIVGWSSSTMFLMSKRYAHIGQTAMRDAVSKLE